jgi:hypothetical protein
MSRRPFKLRKSQRPKKPGRPPGVPESRDPPVQGRLVRAGLWRWRRNPLRRLSDLVEAWVLLMAWVLALAGGALAGLVTASAAHGTFDRQRAERGEVAATVVDHRTDAAATEDAETTRGADHRTWATVRWTAPDGAVRTGRTRVEPHAPVGTRVTVWTDRQGALAAPPLNSVEALLESGMLGATATAAANGAVWACAYAVRERLQRRRLAQWDEAWQRLDTRWGGKTG